MTWVRSAWLLGALVLAGLCVMAATGLSQIDVPLITLAVLVLMVGGGNWLSGRSGAAHGAPAHGAPVPGAADPAPPSGPEPPDRGPQ